MKKRNFIILLIIAMLGFGIYLTSIAEEETAPAPDTQKMVKPKGMGRNMQIPQGFIIEMNGTLEVTNIENGVILKITSEEAETVKKIQAFIAKTKTDHDKFAAEENEGKKEGKLYACPMKCVEPTDKPSRCPKCGMKLMKLIKMKGEVDKDE